MLLTKTEDLEQSVRYEANYSINERHGIQAANSPESFGSPDKVSHL